jgi:hypothetical protein
MNTRTLMRFAMRLVTSGIACAAPAAFAFNVYTVGIGDGCQFSDIQAAVDAAAQNPGEDYIFIQGTPSMRWGEQHVVITDQDVDIVGGFAACTDNEPTPGYQATLQGESGHSVIEIEGASNVFIENLELFGASMDASHQGGGIYYGGAGTLTLDGTWVHNNETGYGGGVAMNASAPSTLVLQSSTVSANTATVEGGGIRLDGSSVLYVDSASYIAENAAPNGSGGGIKLAAPAAAYVSGTVDLNTAQYGGGIAAYSVDGLPVVVTLYASNAAQPVSIYGNTAAALGGGVYIKPSQSATAVLCAQDFSIDANSATDGAAIDADTNNGTGALVLVNQSCPIAASPFPAVACTTGPFCNEIADNTGTTIRIEQGGAIHANRFAARRNHGVIVVSIDSSEGTSNGLISSQLHDCLLADNVETADVVDVYPAETEGVPGANTQLIIDSCTIVNNTVNAPLYDSIDVVANFAELTNSIVYDPGAQVIYFDGAAGDLTAQYDVVNNASTLPSGAGITQGVPSFVDVSNQDYHLTRSSLGVDYAPASDAIAIDLDGGPRSVDLVDMPNVYGPMDVGAYEIATQADRCSAADTIFCDGFE